MTIAPGILARYPQLSEAQRAVVGHTEGPLLVIAGPGSGKTHSLVLRALTLLLLGKASPRELVLCTFTEKAAFEMRDRIAAAVQNVAYSGDLSELSASTIHSFCNRVLTRHRHRTGLGHGYDTLDELTQLLFLFEHFEEVIGAAANDLFLHRWKTRWTAIESARGYFDKITEELVDPERLIGAGDPFLHAIGEAYRRYERVLFEGNRTDFAHLQSLVLELLGDTATADAVTRDIRYVLVDEYQDTNYVQEQLLLKLSERSRNLCVVGDEDQSLYRFRGATVRNILEFPQRMPGCTVLKLTTNYRSHRAIVERYDRWMASADWSNPKGASFRYNKTIEADAATTHPGYPSVLAIWGKDRRDEAARFADLVDDLRRKEVDLDKAREAARDIDQPGNQTKAIVSVMMLREGWDVRNVTVVLGLRPFTAKAEILPEQVIGRGLRLMVGLEFPDRTQTLEVLGTRNLLQVLRDQLEAEGVGVASTKTDPPPPVIIAPVQERLAFDIAIPLTKPSLVHDVRKLGDLDVGALEAIYDQEDLAETFRVRLKLEFATTETEVHQADLPPLEVRKTVFNYVATYNDFERRFAQFLDGAGDVRRFASLGTTEQGASGTQFRVDYLKPSGAIGFYHPDLVVVQEVGSQEVHWILETKGRVWEGTTAKDDAMGDWCQRVSAATGAAWRYQRVDQVRFDAVRATSLGGLITRL